MYRSRYRRIVFFFGRVVLGLIFWDLLLPRLGLRGLARRTRPARLRRIAVSFRAMAIQMGGVMIKVGQFLSARVDVLPQEITDELVGLQDEVPAEDFEQIRALAEAELGAPLARLFAEFDPRPMAAASLGQVHRARLVCPPSAEEAPPFVEVVVKIQRPNIPAIIETDLAALRTVGNWLKRYPPIRRRADVPALLDEFASVLYEEIDYLAEARNAEKFARNFRRFRPNHRPGVRVPRVVWERTTRRVLTLENVQAIKITDYEAIQAAGIDRGEVAEFLFTTYLRQIFEHNFFHADPHPGNLFVNPRPEHAPPPQAGGQKMSWELVFVDFGMMGHVPPNLRAGLREMAIATGSQDPARLVRSYQMLGVLLPEADLELLERAEAKAFEQFWGKSMAELRDISLAEMQAFAKEFRQLIFSMPFQVPQDLILLGRTVAILSGMCTGLNPDFNFWRSITPFANKLIAEEARTEWDFWQQELEKLLRLLASLPARVDRVLEKMERGQLETRSPDIRDQTARLERAIHRVAAGLVFAALLLAGVQLYLAGETGMATAMLTAAALTLVWMAGKKPRQEG